MASESMRIKEVGATINLGQYSSLHVTIGEEQEYTGLNLQRTLNYLRRIAHKVDGVLNLPDAEPTKEAPAASEPPQKQPGTKIYSFGSSTPIWYDHKTHTYTSEQGVRYESVTQLLSAFYPFNADNKIAQEYMDFAASYGNLMHAAIQNSVMGKMPKKTLVKAVCEQVLEAMGPYDTAYVEQPIVLPAEELAGRFDIITRKGEKCTLWDVKTNSEMYKDVQCTLPDALYEEYSEFWKPETTYGEHCLQLNLYAYMIERTSDIVIDELKIIYVPDGFKEIIDVPKTDISAILTAYGGLR